MRVVVDLDGMVYRCGFAAEHRWWFLRPPDGEGLEFSGKRDLNAYAKEHDLDLDDCELWSHHQVEPVENAIHVMGLVMNRIANELHPDTVVCYLSGETNFRYDIATIKPYKGNRIAVPKPVHYQALRDYAIEHLDAIVTENMEADDALAIDQTKYNPDCCIVSNDKDMLQVPGHHWDWTKDEHYHISIEEGVKRLYIQIIAGDSTDNIQGVPGLGIKKATNWIAPCKSRRDLDAAIYEAYEGDHEAALENARLVYVLRTEDDMFNFIYWPKP